MKTFYFKRKLEFMVSNKNILNKLKKVEKKEEAEALRNLMRHIVKESKDVVP